MRIPVGGKGGPGAPSSLMLLGGQGRVDDWSRDGSQGA